MSTDLRNSQTIFYTSSNTNTTNQQFKVDYFSLSYQNLNRLECFLENAKSVRIINDIFKKYYDWGSRNLISSFYKRRVKSIIYPIEIDKE